MLSWCPPRGVLPGLWLKIRLEMLPFMVSWFPPRGVIVSTLWCRGVHPVVLWCPPCGVVVSTPWCHGVHPVVSWFPPRGVLPGLWLKIRLEMLPFMVSWCCGVMVSTPWCRCVHPVVSWCPHCGVVVSTPWCHGVLPGFWLKIRLEMLSSMVSWFPPPVVSWCLAWFVA